MFAITYPITYEACKKEMALKEKAIIKHLPKHPRICINR